MKRFIIIVVFLCFSHSSFAALLIEPTQLWVFGDSYSDTGNQKAILGTFPPNPPYFDGRLSNGPVWIEHVALEFGLSANASRLFGMPFTEATNFSQAGAPTDNTGFPAFPAGLRQQVDFFINDTLVNFPSINTATSLFVVFGGANDSFFLPRNATAAAINNQASISAANIGGIIRDLYATGAVEFFVPNIPGNVLEEIYAFNIVPAPQIAQDFSQAFNAALDVVLDNIRNQFSDINITELDSAALFNSILTNPASFGITNIIDPCVSYDANSVIQGVCGNPEQHFFFDSLHPSSSVHDAWADAALTALVPIPAAVWLFISAIVGLIGISQRKYNS